MAEGFAYFWWRIYLRECWAALYFRPCDYTREWRRMQKRHDMGKTGGTI